LAYIAASRDIPISALSIIVDHPTEYPNLGRKFQVVTLLDQRPGGRFYSLLVDLTDNRTEENISALLSAESQARQARYGKLEPALYTRLQALKDDDMVYVAVWMTAPQGKTMTEQQQTAFATLATKYPEAQSAMERSGKPMDVSDPALARRIESDYVALLNAGMKSRTQHLVTELQQRGFTVTTYDGMPAFATLVPKSVILELNRREDVGSIFLVGATVRPAMISVAPTILAPAVWDRGYNGSGVTIAILEPGNVDSGNTFLNLAPLSRPGINNLDLRNHATTVASVAASFHGTYRGIAWGATILSVGMNGTDLDLVSGLQWAFNQGAQIVNVSAVVDSQANTSMHWTDKAFDYWARYRFRMVTQALGNYSDYIRSPGKAWNVLSVGAFDDNNDPSWSNDQMWPSSPWINPASPNNDREKPEVVAVGRNVTALGVNNQIATWEGTSFAAPQVAGLDALLIHRHSDLTLWPEASRAIIMASATHNITGPSGIPTGQDLRDGAGAINAVLADTIARTRNLSDVNPCTTSCWWGNYISSSSFPVGTWQFRYFTANKGDLIRAAIAWWSNADMPANNYSFDRLDTDLQLGIIDPDGLWVPGAWSASWDNNYELVEGIATKTGTYRIAIYNQRADEWSNYVGIALLRQSMLYLPAVMKDSP